jgi:hypothetical protein
MELNTANFPVPAEPMQPPPALIDLGVGEIKPAADRLVIVQYVSHVPRDAEPYQVESRFERILTVKEQVYSRRTQVGIEGAVVDVAWLKGLSGEIVIENLEGKYLQTKPSEEETADIAERKLLLSYDYSWDGFVILPGESFSFNPTSPGKLTLRGLHKSKQVRYVIHVYPG